MYMLQCADCGKLNKLTHDAPAAPTSPVMESKASIEKVSWALYFERERNTRSMKTRKFFISVGFIQMYKFPLIRRQPNIRVIKSYS